jgi:hypothetical protein
VKAKIRAGRCRRQREAAQEEVAEVEIFAKDTAIGAPALDNTRSREPKLLLYVLTYSVHFAGCNGSQAPK